MKKKKLIWVNYISHHVYTGWFFFFNKFFDFSYYDNNSKNINIGEKSKLVLKKNITIFGNSIRLVDSKNINIKKNDVLIIGDLFSLLLVFKYLFRKNTIFYTEIIVRKQDKLLKKILVYLYSLLFINKKILVPTKEAYNVMKRVSKNILYFPQIYYGELYKNNSLLEKKLKIIFVGNIPYWAKNLYFLLETLLELDSDGVDFEIGLCGRINGVHLEKVKKYKEKLKDKLNYLGEFNHDQLSEQYLNNNLFILPSLSDPIGAVVLEAMAHSLPVIVSENVGAKSYIKDKVNGFIYKNNNKEDLKEKILFFIDKNNRIKFGEESYKIVKNNYFYKNKELIEEKYKEFSNFLNK